MKKIITSLIIIVIGIIVILKFCQTGSNKPLIKINALEIQLETSKYHDITDLGYIETDRRDIIYLFTRIMAPKIYAITDTEGTVDFLDKENALISYIGLDVDENVSTLEIDDIDFLSISKEELAKDYDLVEFNDLVRFVYKDHYFVCLSYTDEKLDGFAVMYNKDGKRSVRDVDLCFRDYKDQWIIK